MPDEKAVVVEREVDASVERVFRAWTDPVRLCRWFHSDKMTVDSAEVELRVGGRFRIMMRDTDSAVNSVFGTFRRVEPPHLLEFTWQWETNPIEPGETLVRVELEPLGQRTLLRLIHSRFSSENSFEAHSSGWNGVLASLALYFAEHEKEIL